MCCWGCLLYLRHWASDTEQVWTLRHLFSGAGEGVRFSLKGTTYQNNSLVTLEDIGEGDDALLCVTDQPACCRPPYSNRAGNWLFPNGTRIPTSGSQWDFHRTRGQSAISLQRRRGGVNGIYSCEIPDAMIRTQTIYIGVYSAEAGEWYACIYTSVLSN